MKLRNKKTGEIIDVNVKTIEYPNIPQGYPKHKLYNSLAELNKEWEDYEEHKDHWHIGCEGDVFIDNTESNLKIYSSIGNDFNSREEAEKVVEKLKAWKRLKDKGFKFKDFCRFNDYVLVIRATSDDSWSKIYNDLDIIFGDEE